MVGGIFAEKYTPDFSIEFLLTNDVLRHKIAGGKLNSGAYNNGGMWLMSGLLFVF